MQKEILLSGDDWRLFHFKQAEGEKEKVYEKDFWAVETGWLRVNVPGDVHSTLVKRKIIPDPYFGLNNEKCRWVADREWWYRKSFCVPEEWQKKEKIIRLIFEGVDYDAEFWANGKYLGSHQGMFSPIIFDISKIANKSKWVNLAIRISPPPKSRKEIGGRKSNISYAIDYTPILLSMGIWKDVRVVCTGEVYLEDVFIASEIKDKEAIVNLELETVNITKKTKEITYEIRISGKNFFSPTYKKELSKKVIPGTNRIKTELSIPEPALWFPWDKGEQNLYKVEIKIKENKEEQDSIEKSFGIREIKMLRNIGAPKDSFPFTFSINGKREYIRGANWTNIDLLPGNLKKERYKKLLTMVKEANMNMLRIHGWHIIEKEEFYNLCDELGILVWQEFMFCNMNYPQDKEYLKKVKGESIQAVKTIRNHPSLVIWCGGNEYTYKENKKLIDMLQQICKEYGASRSFIPISDIDRRYYPKGNWLIPEEHKGDYHSWDIWARFAPITDYSKDKSLFTSEFGLQAVPNIENLKKFIPEDELWPPGYCWEYHFAQLSKITYHAYYIKSGVYSKDVRPEEVFKNLEEFIEYSQQAQAEVLKFAIEHYRRRKYYNSGCMFWCFNEPWPSIIWSVVDWYLRPKKAYYAVKEAYSPLLISLQHNKKEWEKNERFKGEVWIVNDYLKTFKNCVLEIKIVDNNSNLLEKKSIKIEKVEENSAKKVFILDWSIPEEIRDKFKVLVSLKNSENLVIASNKYNFRIEEGNV